MSAYSISPLLIKVDFGNRFVNEAAKREKRIASLQCGPSDEVWTRWWKFSLRCSGNAFALFPGTDVGNPTAVLAKVCSNVVLSVAAEKHPFHDCDFPIVESHRNTSLVIGKA